MICAVFHSETSGKKSFITSSITCRPHFKLLFPLFHRNTRITQNQCPLSDSAACSHSYQTFSSSTRQYNDTRSSSTIAKHFSKAFLLIRTKNSCWLQVNTEQNVQKINIKWEKKFSVTKRKKFSLDIRINNIITKIVFG